MTETDRGEAERPDKDDFESKERERRSGMLLGLKLHLIGVAWLGIVALLALDVLPGFVVSFCLWQWVYLIPAIVTQRDHGRPDRARGVLAIGLLTMALWTLVVIVMITIFCAGLGK